jgi:hypothetical protein
MHGAHVYALNGVKLLQLGPMVYVLRPSTLAQSILIHSTRWFFVLRETGEQPWRDPHLAHRWKQVKDG